MHYIMPSNIDLDVKWLFYKKWIKRNWQFFSSWNFHTIFGEPMAVSYEMFKPGRSKKKELNVCNLQVIVPFDLHITKIYTLCYLDT